MRETKRTTKNSSSASDGDWYGNSDSSIYSNHCIWMRYMQPILDFGKLTQCTKTLGSMIWYQVIVWTVLHRIVHTRYFANSIVYLFCPRLSCNHLSVNTRAATRKTRIICGLQPSYAYVANTGSLDHTIDFLLLMFCGFIWSHKLMDGEKNVEPLFRSRSQSWMDISNCTNKTLHL